MEPGVLTKVINDFLTTVDGELCLTKGNYFQIHEIIDKYWCYGQSNYQTGKFPLGYLHKVDIPEFKDNEFICISIAPFRSEQPGDLSFSQGEIIIGEERISDDWLSGRMGPSNGMFPANHVWELDLSIIKQTMQKKAVKRKAKVTTSMTAQLDEELDLVKDEIVTVYEVTDGWCRGVKKNGKEGIFPEQFIMYLENSNSDEVDKSEYNTPVLESPYLTPSTSDNGHKNSEQLSSLYPNIDEDPVPSYDDLFPESDKNKTNIPTDFDLNPLGVKPYAITLYTFNSQYPNELSFEEGQVVELIRYNKDSKDWLEGKIGDNTGLFPVKYVNIIVDCEENKNIEEIQQNDFINENIVKTENKELLAKNSRVLVEFTFVAQMDGDLSVHEGEIVTIVEITNEDWITVENNLGEIGLVPRSYLTTNINVENEIFHDAYDDFVVIRKNNEMPNVEDNKLKRLSEPHRPAPPAPSPGRTPIHKPNNNNDTSSESLEEINNYSIQKKADQRQNVISELYYTEKDYVRDLKMTFETFNLHNPFFLESKGVDVAILFGNIQEIIDVAEELLELIQKSMKGIDEDYQAIGPCFLKMAEKLRIAYGKYCSNHEASLALLQKYEENKEIQNIFNKGVETLKMQVICFDMNSILIKPVQRILKYPLILNELLKCTNDDHPDKSKILEAASLMADVASYINEYKRKKELASKYLNSDNSLMGKIGNFNMHSVAKKSSRFSAKISASLGLSSLPIDSEFEEVEKDFNSLEIHTNKLIKNVESCTQHLNEETVCGEVLTELLNQYYQGYSNNEISNLRRIQSIIKSQYFQNFKSTVDKKVIIPLKTLLNLLHGPSLLIQKRNDKLLDYNSAIGKGMLTEELSTSKSNFEALNQQLLEELPLLTNAGMEILYDCIDAFASARKLFGAQIMKQYVMISETSDAQIKNQDIIGSFLVCHNLLYNQISRFSGKGNIQSKEDDAEKYCLQSDIHINELRSKYAANKLYIAKASVTGIDPLDISVVLGSLVAVIKNSDPMGNTSRWYVDNGAMKGFIDSQYLEPENSKPTQSSSSFSTSVNNMESSVNLISLDSPVHEVKKSENSQAALYHNLLEELDAPPKYENIYKINSTTSQDEYMYALYDFDGKNLTGTLSIRTGEPFKVIRKHDEKNNHEWWLVEARNGNSGYVPFNYLGPVKNSGK